MRRKGTGKGVGTEARELSCLVEVAQALDSNLDLRDAARPLLKAVSKHLRMKRGKFLLLNRRTEQVTVEEAHGLSLTEEEQSRYAHGSGLIGRVVATGQPALGLSSSDEPRFLKRTGPPTEVPKREISWICAPVRLGRQVVGALCVDRLFEPTVPVAEDLRVLSVIASMVGRAVRLRESVQEERQRLVAENIRLHEELKDRFRPDNIIGNSHEMQEVYDLVARVCKMETTVLLLGESGVGKELVAHAVHYNSPRADGSFVKVNCAALPENILESELFGHEKGAFTGAHTERKGRFELADGGTIFLDEIGDLTPRMQIRLLRVLQEREFERVGGTETIQVDVRVIAATNRELEELTDPARFRQDLYYRLNVFPIHIPPLRERKTDILLLADYFVEKYSRKYAKEIKRISTPAIDMLVVYHWPGNVRELENCIERAVLMSNDDVIHGHHLPPTLQTAEASGTTLRGTLGEKLDALERELIVEALKSSRGNRAKAARALGITERLMGLRVRKHAIDARRFRP